MRSSAVVRETPGRVTVVAALAFLAAAPFGAPGQETPPALTFASPDASRPLESLERLSVELPARIRGTRGPRRVFRGWTSRLFG